MSPLTLNVLIALQKYKILICFSKKVQLPYGGGEINDMKSVHSRVSDNDTPYSDKFSASAVSHQIFMIFTLLDFNKKLSGCVKRGFMGGLRVI